MRKIKEIRKNRTYIGKTFITPGYPANHRLYTFNKSEIEFPGYSISWESGDRYYSIPYFLTTFAEHVKCGLFVII